VAVALVLAAGLGAWAQSERPVPERAARDEVEASSKLRANSRDVEALVARGTARIALGKVQAALADLRRAVALDAASLA
jgi:hypothetical protein